MTLVPVALNTCYGGFGLSQAAILRARELGADWAMHPHAVLVGEYYKDNTLNTETSDIFNRYKPPVERTDPILIQVVRELGDKANGYFANIQLKYLEPGTRYQIHEYDGMETLKLETEQIWMVA